MMKRENDVGKRQSHHYYFKSGLMDFQAGWVLGYASMGGPSVGELFHVFNNIKDGNPDSWVREFLLCADYEKEQAILREKAGDIKGAGIKFLAESVARRAALAMADPTTDLARTIIVGMESAFQRAIAHKKLDIAAVDFDFFDKKLPAYASTHIKNEDILYIVVGGGDTFREDLFFFGGSAALKRGYKVIMPDLPGQGKTPYDQLYFGKDTVDALVSIISSYRKKGFKGRIILTGYSGGGYFTAKSLEQMQVDAWVASTPIIDMNQVIEVAMPALIRRNPGGQFQRTLVSLVGKANPVLESALRKYDWQFGPRGIADLLDACKEVGPFDYRNLTTPSLFLVGEGEDPEGLRQASIIFDELSKKNPESQLLRFPACSGADAHCQVNNLGWAQHLIFEWLASIGLGIEK